MSAEIGADLPVPRHGPLSQLASQLQKPPYIVAICGLILFYRVPDAFLNPQFYVEDGVHFFVEAREHGLASIFESFTNYLHLTPRLFAYLASPLPPRYAPAAYNFYAFAIQLSVVAYLFSERINVRFKPLMALTMVLTPCLDNTCFVKLTNSQWSLAMLMTLLLISTDPLTRVQKFFDIALLPLTGLTGPFSTLFLPAFIYRAITRRSKWSYVLLAIVAGFTVVQLVLVVIWPWGAGRPDMSKAFNVHDPNWHGVFGDCISGVMIAGVYAHLIFENSWVLTVATVILFTSLIVLALRRRDHSSLICLYCGCAVMFAASYSWKSAPSFITGLSQYHFFLRVMLSWTLVQTLVTASWPRVASGILLAWGTVVAIPALQIMPAQDFHWSDASRLVDSPGEVEFPITTQNYLMILHNPESSKSATSEEMLAEKREWTTRPDGKPFEPVIFAFKSPVYFCGVRIKYRLKSLDGGSVTARIVWLNSNNAPPYPNKGFMDLASTDDKLETHTAEICGAIDHLYVLVDKKAVHFEIIELKRLY